MPENNPLTPGTCRRAALARMGLSAIGLGYAGAVGYPVYRYLASPVARAYAAGQVSEVAIPFADLPPKGDAMLFKFGHAPAILVHDEEGTYRCYSAVCTHLACTVSFEKTSQKIECACHGGVYDPKTGAVLAGPPPRPLPAFIVEPKDAELIIRRA